MSRAPSSSERSDQRKSRKNDLGTNQLRPRRRQCIISDSESNDDEAGPSASPLQASAASPQALLFILGSPLLSDVLPPTEDPPLPPGVTIRHTEDALRYNNSFDAASIPDADIIIMPGSLSRCHRANRAKVDTALPGLLEKCVGSSSCSSDGLYIYKSTIALATLSVLLRLAHGLSIPKQDTDSKTIVCIAIQVARDLDAPEETLDPLKPAYKHFLTSSSEEDMLYCAKLARRYSWPYGIELVCHLSLGFTSSQMDAYAARDAIFGPDGSAGRFRARVLRRVERRLVSVGGKRVWLPALMDERFIWNNCSGGAPRHEIDIGRSRTKISVAQWFSKLCKTLEKGLRDRPCVEALAGLMARITYATAKDLSDHRCSQCEKMMANDLEFFGNLVGSELASIIRSTAIPF